MQNRFLDRALGGLIRDFGQPVMLWQAAALAAALGVAYLLARLLRGRLRRHRLAQTTALRYGAESLDKALFPLLGWMIVAGVQWPLENVMHTTLLDLALVPLFGIALLYVAFYLARRAFARSGHGSGLLYVFEKLLTVAVWAGMALSVLGIQGDVLRWMSTVRFRIGVERLTLLSLASGLFWICVTVLAAQWFGGMLEDRLARSRRLDANLQVVLARVGRAGLLVAALLISLNVVGIDLTVLGVFGGALGVGLGFGLQKIASNYVSGFIILLDRSLRLGDAITVGTLQGIVTQIRTRYTVVRGLDGIETLIPNERLITDIVQNHSSYLTRGYAKVAVQAAYGADVEQVMRLLAAAPVGIDRVAAEPAPCPFLAGFGADGINYELGFWIENAAQGTAVVRSEVNLAIWRTFRAHGIEIPYPQREVRIVGMPAATDPVKTAEAAADGR